MLAITARSWAAHALSAGVAAGRKLSTPTWVAVFVLAAGCSAPVAAGGSSRADTAWVRVGPAAGGTRAFVATPPGQAAAPAVIVAHEGQGLGGSIHEFARRLSLQGYLVIVPDLDHGESAPGVESAQRSGPLDPARAMNDLDAAAEWLRAQPRTAKSRMGVVGFSQGGVYSLDFALHRPVAAAVIFYGPPQDDPVKLRALSAPLQGHFGAADEGISAERVEAFKAAMKQAGKSAEIYLYPAAGHGFLHEGTPAYHADAARLAWARLLGFLQRTLRG